MHWIKVSVESREESIKLAMEMRHRKEVVFAYTLCDTQFPPDSIFRTKLVRAKEILQALHMHLNPGEQKFLQELDNLLK